MRASKIIIIIAPPDDVHALNVRAELLSLNKLSEIWDTETVLSTTSISYGDKGFLLTLRGEKYYSDEIGAIWWRRPKLVKIPQGVVDPQAKRLINESCKDLVDAFLEQLSGRIVNSPKASMQADNKILQLCLAKRCGLDIPNTLVSSVYEEVWEFTRKHKIVVMKSLTPTLGCFGEAREIDQKTLNQYKAEIGAAPVIYQESVTPAIDLRVTVVGQEMYTAQIRRNNPVAEKFVDWRLDPSSDCIPTELPDEIKKKMYEFMANFGLVYGAIDLRKTPDGRYVFLEINTAGQYLWVEIDTGMPISRAIAKLLMRIAEA